MLNWAMKIFNHAGLLGKLLIKSASPTGISPSSRLLHILLNPVWGAILNDA